MFYFLKLPLTFSQKVASRCTYPTFCFRDIIPLDPRSYMCDVHVQLFATPWSVAHQAPLSMAFSRQEYSPFSPIGDLPDPGIEPVSSVSPNNIAQKFSTMNKYGLYEKVLPVCEGVLLLVAV